MADTKFMNFAEVTPSGTDSVLVGNSSNGVRRAQLANIREAIGATAQNCGGIIEDHLAQNGYVKFANGLMIQHIYVPANGDVTSGRIEFPKPFSSNDVVAAHCCFDSLDATSESCSIVGVSNTYVAWKRSVGYYGVNIIAIGF